PKAVLEDVGLIQENEMGLEIKAVKGKRGFVQVTGVYGGDLNQAVAKLVRNDMRIMTTMNTARRAAEEELVRGIGADDMIDITGDISQLNGLRQSAENGRQD